MPELLSYEIDPAIYRASITRMPGQHSIRAKSPKCVRSKKVELFECADICERAPLLVGKFTGVWLDFCGPLSIKRLNSFSALAEQSRVSVLTFLKGRYGHEFRDEVKRHGSTIKLLTSRLGVPTDVYSYGNMTQVLWRSPSPQPSSPSKGRE